MNYCWIIAEFYHSFYPCFLPVFPARTFWLSQSILLKAFFLLGNWKDMAGKTGRKGGGDCEDGEDKLDDKEEKKEADAGD